MTDTGAAGVAGAAGSAGNGAGNGSAAGALRVGDDVRIETDGGKTVYSGRVFCFDAVNDVVVLEEPHPQSTLKQDLRLLKYSAVSKVTVVESASGPAVALPSVPDGLLARREKAALALAEREANRMGKGVTAEAQILFDHLYKTYRCKWRGKDIITELGITIRPPYTAESCSGKDSAALHRFKKLVESVNARISQPAQR